MRVSQDHPKVSVVVPLYNEASCLETSFGQIENYLTSMQLDYEVVLVNDGSADASEDICHRIVNRNSFVRLISYRVNRGKGFAVKTGVSNAVGKYIIFTDADLAVPVRFIGSATKRLETGTPVVIGSRHLPESSFKVREGPLRQVLGETFRRLSQLSLGLRVSDITCGLKGFEKKAALDIFSRSKINRWGYDAEIIFLAQKLGYAIEEFPVNWHHSFDSKVSVGIDSLRTLTEILQIHYYYLSKQYKC